MAFHRYVASYSSFELLEQGSLGNYDISKLHYDGPGNVPGGPGHGYGYDIRVEGLNSGNAPAATVSA